MKLLKIILSLLPFFGGAQNLPPYSFNIYDTSASQGYYFMSPYSNQPPYNYPASQLILDRLGKIVYYKTFDLLGTIHSIDFKLQPDGRMSYFNISKNWFMFLDSTFAEVDSIACVNGMDTDQHDIQILPGGHYLLIGNETRIMNLSMFHWFGIFHNQPGATNAQVLGVVIQEFDENKNLVWEWKGHDHYQFDDVDERWLMSPNHVDWTHANAVELDNDGNILLSLRHFNEITKISRTTGNIIWRFGGKENMFTFLNDPMEFWGQHDIRRVSDSSVSLFDNGQFHTPPYCRALEYVLDEQAHTADLVWNYVYDTTLFSRACGNHQYTGNGNHLVDFGFTNESAPWMVVVKPDMSKVVEMSMPVGYSSYRSFNYTELPWTLPRPGVSCEKIDDIFYLVAEPGYSMYDWSNGATTQSIEITDTGYFWVFVPCGQGYISSEHIHITDVTNPCLINGIDETAVTEPSLKYYKRSGQFTVEFTIPVSQHVEISLISITGQQVSKPVDGFFSPGNHQSNVDVSSLSEGVYLLRMKTAEKMEVRKVHL